MPDPEPGGNTGLIPEIPIHPPPGEIQVPFTNLDSIIPTINEFIAHWTQVNAALGANPLTLPGPYTLAQLTTDRDNLQNLITAVTTADNSRQVAAGDRDIRRAALRERMRQFRATVNGRLAGSVYVTALPRMPTTNASQQAFLRVLDDISNLWTRINAAPPAGFTGPLTLTGGYTLATFNADITALRNAFSAVITAETAATFARRQRDAALAPVRTRLVQYRAAVTGAFTSGHPLIASLPALTPPAGATPDPVTLSGVWDATQQRAVLTWEPSTAPDLAHYSVRYHPGPRYRASEEQTITQVPPGTHTFVTNFGLVASGSVSWFKVYVVLSTGNERGSNAVKVIRP